MEKKSADEEKEAKTPTAGNNPAPVSAPSNPQTGKPGDTNSSNNEDETETPDVQTTRREAVPAQPSPREKQPDAMTHMAPEVARVTPTPPRTETKATPSGDRWGDAARSVLQQQRVDPESHYQLNNQPKGKKK